MNYRHHFHAGNFADVMKHALLVQLVRGLQRKEKGCFLLDTHAGRGGYDFSLAAMGDTLPRAPEHPDGIGRLGTGTDLPAPLADYLGLVQAFNAARAPAPWAFYPGSPWLLRLLARPQDRMAFCEKHPEEFAALQGEFGGDRRVSVHAMDGYRAVRAMLPPPEKRGLVLIDPPFEARDEWTAIVTAVRDGLRRFPSGVYALWYPLTERARVDEFFESLLGLPLPPTLAAEIVVAPEAPKMKGCGLVILNPPWQFDREAAPVLGYLAKALAQTRGGGSSLRWLVPEQPNGSAVGTGS